MNKVVEQKGPSYTREEVILAQTAWGEARGEGQAGIQAVMNCIVNRSKKPKWWGKTISEVCQKPFQFSCWNVNDPNSHLLAQLDPAKDKIYKLCLEMAKRACSGALVDLTNGATHYHEKHMRPAPAWVSSLKYTCTIGNHSFYK